jgi:hypothetical protein
MNCPNCNNEMEQGFLQGMRRVAWVKKHHKVSLLPKQGEILLENNAFKDFIFSACAYSGTSGRRIRRHPDRCTGIIRTAFPAVSGHLVEYVF